MKPKKIIKTRWWWFYIGLTIGLAPCIFLLARLERGMSGTGSEIFVVTIVPILVYFIRWGILDDREAKKKQLLQSTTKPEKRRYI